MKDESKLSPRQFMQRRRPHLFSDSAIKSEKQLTREILEFQLSRVTAHKKEADFEHLCRRLVERTICPNVVPQTGPTGGGDSKADAVTYPVSDAVAERWYLGYAREVASEVWAFAFSAKAQWQAKIRADVAGIVGTGRDYKRLYFITNQMVSDKKRAGIEDELLKKHGIRVHLLDLNWILEKVFGDHLEELAAMALGLSVTSRDARTLGPHDAARERDLTTLSRRLDDPSHPAGYDYQLAKDAQEAAFLARGLERPRVEVLGRFEQALRFAQRSHVTALYYHILYSKAWTQFWWYEDFADTVRCYNEYESFLHKTDQASDMELASNLLTLLGPPRPEFGGEHQAWLAQRRDVLLRELGRLEGDVSRPNNSHFAKTVSAFLDIQDALRTSASTVPAFARLAELLKEGDRFVEYPLRRFANTVVDLGDLVGECEGFDALFDCARELLAERDGAEREGKLRFRRAAQKCEAGQYATALDELAHARVALAAEDSQEDLARVLLLCADCYQSLGLFFAARSECIFAHEHLLSDLKKSSTISPLIVYIARRIAWCDLRLGKVPEALSWYGLSEVFLKGTKIDDELTEMHDDDAGTFDVVLGIRLLLADRSLLGTLGLLVPVLKHLDLPCAWASALYALGYPDEAVTGFEPLLGANRSVDDVASKLLEQPARDQLLYKSTLHNRGTTDYESAFLGAEIVVRVADELAALLFAEQLLAAIEIFGATFSLRDVPYLISSIRLEIKVGGSGGSMPAQPPIEDLASGSVTIHVAPELVTGVIEDSGRALGEWLHHFLATLLGAGFVGEVSHLESNSERIGIAMSRALAFQSIITATTNALGRQPKYRLEDWSAGNVNPYPMLRKDEWHSDRHLHRATSGQDATINATEGPMRQVVVPFISIHLWDRAGWIAAGYEFRPDSPPLLILVFRNVDAARLIFDEWRRELGNVDENEILRFSFIERSSSYTLSVGVDIESYVKYRGSARLGSNSTLISAARGLEMNRTQNLGKFKEWFRKWGVFGVTFGSISDSGQPTPDYDLILVKRKVLFRKSEDIGESDPDCKFRDERGDA